MMMFKDAPLPLVLLKAEVPEVLDVDRCAYLIELVGCVTCALALLDPSVLSLPSRDGVFFR